MIILPNHRLGVVFVPKCASTTVEQVFAGHAAIRLRGSPGLKHASFAEAEEFILPLLARKGIARPHFFAVVRHPAEVLKSWFNYRNRPELSEDEDPERRARYLGDVSFEAFVAEAVREQPAPWALVPTQLSFIAGRDGAVAVDTLIQADHLDEILPAVLARFGIRLDAMPERCNVSTDIVGDLDPDLVRDVETSARFAADHEIYLSAQADPHRLSAPPRIDRRVSTPFIIWTLRRSGGTTLADLMMDMADRPGRLHEPFNRDRVHGAVAIDWETHRDLPDLRRGIDAALAGGPAMKHTYELQRPRLNRVLMHRATRQGYRHVLLDRRSEADRLLSLALAQNTGIWGRGQAVEGYERYRGGDVSLAPFDIDWLIGHARFCHARRAALNEQMRKEGIVPFTLRFEDLFGDPAVGLAMVERLTRFLGLDPDGIAHFRRHVGNALANRGQNSASLLELVPNIAAARAALNRAVEPYAFTF